MTVEQFPRRPRPERMDTLMAQLTPKALIEHARRQQDRERAEAAQKGSRQPDVQLEFFL
jgi:hypothetical protein